MKYLFLLFLLISCSDNKFRKVEELDSFRIVGVISPNPEVAPGDTLIPLQLFVSDIGGGGRTITGTVEACIDPGISLGAPVTCDHDPSKAVDTYTIDTINDADLGAANFYTGLATDTFQANIPATIFVGRSAREQSNGVAYIVIFRFDVDGVQYEVFKRLIATNRVTKNNNPTINNVFLNGANVAGAKPAKGDEFSLDSNAPENYNFIEVDGTVVNRSETLKVAWYVNQGEFDKPKSDVGEAVKYKTDPPGNSMILLSVLRDERGGIDIERFIIP